MVTITLYTARIVLKPSVPLVRCVGNEVTFNCDVDGVGRNIIDTGVIRWEMLQNGEFRTISISQDISIMKTRMEDKLTSELNIANLMTSLTGLYRCVETVSGEVSKNSTLNVSSST